MRYKECVLELRSFWLLWLVTGHAASLAHGLNALEGMWSDVLTVCLRFPPLLVDTNYERDRI